MADYNSAYTGEQIDAAVGNAKTAADIKTAYESNADTNAFTDAEQAKLTGIETGAEVNTVDSVNGATGVVVLTTGDITEDTDANYVTDAQLVVIGNTSGTNTGDQDISGIATNASAISTLDGEVVKKADYTPAHSILVQQSGTGAPTSLGVATGTLVGRLSGGSSEIDSLTSTEVRTLLNVEDGADVTDTANVTAAGALMDSEVVNLDQVKAFDSADYATAAQGALADSALQSGDNVSELTNDAGYLTTALQSGDNISELVNDSGYLTSSSTITDYISGLIEAPSDKDYKLVVKSPYACTITETTTISTSGTATATFKINTTALGGTANSVSSTEESQAHSSSNSVSAGDDIVLTISSASSCENLSFTIKFTRSLA